MNHPIELQWAIAVVQLSITVFNTVLKPLRQLSVKKNAS